MAMVPWKKKTLPSHRYEKMTIVEVYSEMRQEMPDECAYNEDFPF